MNLLSQWNRWSKIPGGKYLFSLVVGRKIPYSGSIDARIDTLEAGHARVKMRDRRKVRNHLDCIHAVALMNLGELTSGLAMVAGLPKDLRAILTSYQIEYFKKSRGTITAECHCEVPTEKVKKEYLLSVDLKNSEGILVCRAKATWIVGPA